MTQNFRTSLGTLVAGLDPERHAAEIGKLQSCRDQTALERLADEGGGWLTDRPGDPRLRLVKHGSGTFLVLAYEDGWGTTLSQAPFYRRR